MSPLTGNSQVCCYEFTAGDTGKHAEEQVTSPVSLASDCLPGNHSQTGSSSQLLLNHRGLHQ
jgi:hypothetical protein